MKWGEREKKKYLKPKSIVGDPYPTAHHER
jgi:hypothetical protein